MVTLKNARLANKHLITAYGKIQFSAEGKAEVEDVVGEKLSNLKGFSLEVETSPDDEENYQDAEDSTTETDSIVEDSEEESDEAEISFAEELEKMNVPQLKKYAKEHDIDVTDLSKKSQLIEAILNK